MLVIFGNIVIGINIVNRISVVVMIGLFIFFMVFIIVCLVENCGFLCRIWLVFFIINMVLFMIILIVKINLNSVIVLIFIFSSNKIVKVLISEMGIVMVGISVGC